MLIQLWGVRGSSPSPLSNDEYSRKLCEILNLAISAGLNDPARIDSFLETIPDDLRYVYGGDTTCATVTSSSQKKYIIDCGTGIRRLGYELMKGPCGKGQGEVNILLTHNHWDHLQGLPFFTPLYVPGNVIHFYSPFPDQEKHLIDQMSPPFFPAPFEKTQSRKEFHLLDVTNRQSLKLEEDLVLDFYPLKHPGGSFAYRFRQGGRTFIFATDAEFTGESLEKQGRETDFFDGADLLVLDSQYTLQESFSKFDWGHTSYTMAVNCAIRWNVKNLVLTHHEPAYPDSMLKEIYNMAVEHAEQMDNDTLKIDMAREGMTFTL